MAVQLQTTDDFAHILDQGHALTLKRREGGEEIPIASARRFVSFAVEAEPTGGHVIQHDVVWQFPWPLEEEPPRVGDLICDLLDNCGTVLQVEQLGGNTRWRCRIRDHWFAESATNWIDIEEAVWDDLGNGPEIVGWQIAQAAVPARIQPEVTTVDLASNPPASLTRYRVVLGEQIPLDHNHRLRDADGAVYRVVEYTQAQRIDRLPVATVEREATT